jgi:hypothetical protein
MMRLEGTLLFFPQAVNSSTVFKFKMKIAFALALLGTFLASASAVSREVTLRVVLAVPLLFRHTLR